ncbi:hypothetical protein EDB19DRAFT_1835117 [Suillus lakei]|nr:hypothetical protein EDB19DRAFT_1835117 [Suillus lakei]
MVTSASAAQGASVVPHGTGGDAGGGCSGGAGGAGDTGGTKATFIANSTGSTCGGKTRVENYVGIDMQGHVASVTHRPVGMGAERVARDTLHAGIQPKPEALRMLYADWKIIVGRDKSNIINGILQTPVTVDRIIAIYLLIIFITGSLIISVLPGYVDRYFSPGQLMDMPFVRMIYFAIGLVCGRLFDRLVWLWEKKPPQCQPRVVNCRHGISRILQPLACTDLQRLHTAASAIEQGDA